MTTATRPQADDLNYSNLDPGIRETVRRLREWGYNTVDSGDGVSKPPVGRDLDIPHVFITVAAFGTLLIEADHLKHELRKAGIPVRAQGRAARVWIQATYDPADGTAIIGVYGLNDAMWPANTGRPIQR